jgi:hypothetical protein
MHCLLAACRITQHFQLPDASLTHGLPLRPIDDVIYGPFSSQGGRQIFVDQQQFQLRQGFARLSFVLGIDWIGSARAHDDVPSRSRKLARAYRRRP